MPLERGTENEVVLMHSAVSGDRLMKILICLYFCFVQIAEYDSSVSVILTDSLVYSTRRSIGHLAYCLRMLRSIPSRCLNFDVSWLESDHALGFKFWED
jgi:hypothetical protein